MERTLEYLRICRVKRVDIPGRHIIDRQVAGIEVEVPQFDDQVSSVSGYVRQRSAYIHGREKLEINFPSDNEKAVSKAMEQMLLSKGSAKQ